MTEYNVIQILLGQALALSYALLITYRAYRAKGETLKKRDFDAEYWFKEYNELCGLCNEQEGKWIPHPMGDKRTHRADAKYFQRRTSSGKQGLYTDNAEQEAEDRYDRYQTQIERSRDWGKGTPIPKR